MFDPEGHLNLSAAELFAMAENTPRRLVNDYLLAGTPRAFQTYDLYCEFRTALAKLLQIHPRTMVIRGSTLLGFSITPRMEKVWRPISAESDIDLAIADSDYFARLDTEIRQWETRQRIPHDKSREYKPYAKRQEYRSFNCVNDD
ncbi:MAG: hypothetical protein NTX50_31815, partial [Candidatus Sumerlaeota bacterium]|nr:hypothetical protein [Candidatus Sumerlaeota bacterium]